MKKVQCLLVFLVITFFVICGFTINYRQKLELNDSIIIKYNAQGVYEEIIDFHRMGKWYSLNDSIGVDCTEMDGKLVCYLNNGVQNSYTVLHKNSGSRVKKQIVFYTYLEKLKNPAIEEFSIEETPVGTIVTWDFKLEIEGDNRKYGMPGLQKEALQARLKKRIRNLKQQVESRPKFETFISSRYFDRLYYISASSIVVPEEANIQKTKEECFQKLYRFLENNALDKTGNKIFFKESLPDGATKLTCGIGVRERLSISDNDIVLDSLPEGRAVVAEIENTSDSYEPFYKDLKKYLSYFSLKPAGKSWEEESASIKGMENLPVRKYIIQPVAE